MTQDELVDLGKVLATVTRLDGTVQLLRQETIRLHETVRRLPCMLEQTDPDCPVAIQDAPHHEKLHSYTDDEDSIVRAAVGAATAAAIDAVKGHKSTPPFAFTFPNGIGFRISAAGAAIVGVGATIWWLFNHVQTWIR